MTRREHSGKITWREEHQPGSGPVRPPLLIVFFAGQVSGGGGLVRLVAAPEFSMVDVDCPEFRRRQCSGDAALPDIVDAIERSTVEDDRHAVTAVILKEDPHAIDRFVAWGIFRSLPPGFRRLQVDPRALAVAVTCRASAPHQPPGR